MTSLRGPYPRHCANVTQLLSKKCCSGGEQLETLCQIWPALFIVNLKWITTEWALSRWSTSKIVCFIICMHRGMTLRVTDDSITCCDKFWNKFTYSFCNFFYCFVEVMLQMCRLQQANDRSQDFNQKVGNSFYLLLLFSLFLLRTAPPCDWLRSFRFFDFWSRDLLRSRAFVSAITYAINAIQWQQIATNFKPYQESYRATFWQLLTRSCRLIVITFYLPSHYGQGTAKGLFGLRVKLSSVYHTVEASHWPFNCWTSSRKAVNISF